jgi:LacI family transcriptional regulator
MSTASKRSTGRAATIKQVALLANVSLSTASLVINGRPGATDEMRRRVLAAAESIDFKPNRMAQGLRTGRGRHFGILVPDIANPFYGELVAGVICAARKLDHPVFITQGSVDPQSRNADFANLVESRCAGLILLDVVESDRPIIETIITKNIPVVQVIRRLQDLRADAVGCDEYSGGKAAMAHMIACGHRQIAVVAGPQASSASRARLEGYRAQLAEAGLALPDDRLVFGNLTRESGYAAAKRLLLPADQGLDAIVCGNDLLALGAIDAIMDAGLRVPEDVAVIGYDDAAFASARPIALTTIHQPLSEMGEMAVTMLSEQMVEPARIAKIICLPPTLVIRRSCGFKRQHQGDGRP